MDLIYNMLLHYLILKANGTAGGGGWTPELRNMFTHVFRQNSQSRQVDSNPVCTPNSYRMEVTLIQNGGVWKSFWGKVTSVRVIMQGDERDVTPSVSHRCTASHSFGLHLVPLRCLICKATLTCPDSISELPVLPLHCFPGILNRLIEQGCTPLRGGRESGLSISAKNTKAENGRSPWLNRQSWSNRVKSHMQRRWKTDR